MMSKLVCSTASVLAASLCLMTSTPAYADDTVECQSRHYQYEECWAGPLSAPQLVYQISNSACIVNRTWG